MTLYHLEKAEIIHANDRKKIRTIKTSFPYPEVVRLKRFVPLKIKRMAPTRRNILLRDQFTCQYCGARIELTIDHIIPKSRGGMDTFENLVACCSRCNRTKGDKTPEEAGMKLLSTPNNPSFLALFKTKVLKSWEPYLFM